MNEAIPENAANFAEDAPVQPDAAEGLVVNLDVYEGPLDVLLALARDQKVDLRKISILKLAEQYLVFIQEARRLHLDLAGDYLVMAAWLAYLKSRLLLPDDEKKSEEPSGEELAARLAFQLRKLEAMRWASEALMGRNKLGEDLFMRGMPEGVRVIRQSMYQCSLFDLLKAYSDFRSTRGSGEVLTMKVGRARIISVEEALERLSHMIGDIPDWTVLQTFLPEGLEDPYTRRSAMASTFNASLEIAKQGRLELRQTQAFGPIFLRRRERVEPVFGDETADENSVTEESVEVKNDDHA